MQIVVKGTDAQWEELTGCAGQAEWIRVADETEFVQRPEAAAFFNLSGDLHHPVYSLLHRPLFINAVANTLKEFNAPDCVVRINGWPGFLQRSVWEIAGKAGEDVKNILGHINKIMRPVADEPGFISARIIAMIINEAYFALEDKVSSKTDIDIAMKLGTNYPLGPFEWAAVISPRNILQLLRTLSLSDNRYRPAGLLVSEAEAR